MRILHLFQWNLKSIIEHLPVIKKQGFTHIQISPLQPLKGELDKWWMLYQPIRFIIGNELGTEFDLCVLCDKAERYGIKIIADIVINHMGNGDSPLIPHETVDSILTDNPSFWKEKKSITNWDDRYQCINYCYGLPVLDLSNRDLQDIIFNFLVEYVACGVEGFRIDSAKSIALPREGSTFLNRLKIFNEQYDLVTYGEVLNVSTELLDEYNQYVHVVTDVQCSDKNKMVKFVESHDTYLGMKFTTDIPDDEILNRYKHLISEYPNTIFYARPYSNSWQTDSINKS